MEFLTSDFRFLRFLSRYLNSKNSLYGWSYKSYALEEYGVWTLSPVNNMLIIFWFNDILNLKFCTRIPIMGSKLFLFVFQVLKKYFFFTLQAGRFTPVFSLSKGKKIRFQCFKEKRKRFWIKGTMGILLHILRLNRSLSLIFYE